MILDNICPISDAPKKNGDELHTDWLKENELSYEDEAAFSVEEPVKKDSNEHSFKKRSGENVNLDDSGISSP